MPVPQRKRWGKRHLAVEAKGTEALRLYTQERLTQAQVAERLGLSRSRAGQLIRAALARATKERAALEGYLLEQTVQTAETAVREAYDAVTRTCARCHGHGVRNGKVCTHCKGDGYFYEPAERRRWIDRMLRANDQLAKIYGHYAPERHQLAGADGDPLDIKEILMAMTPDELAREAQLFLAASDAEREAHGAN